MTDLNDPFNTNERNYLEELVGEGKKFKTIEDLAKGKWHSDAQIEVLNSELTTLKANSANATNLDTLLQEIRKQGKSEPDDGQTKVTEPNDPPQINIEEVVLKTLGKAEQERKTQTNKAATVARMNEVWGADSGKELKNRADSLGLSVEYLAQIAQETPAAFYRLVGLDQDRSAPSGTTVPTGTVRVDGSKSGVRNWGYYQELKKTNPALYKETRIQIQLNKDAVSLGEAFFN